jgi:hypothetical protein
MPLSSCGRQSKRREAVCLCDGRPGRVRGRGAGRRLGGAARGSGVAGSPPWAYDCTVEYNTEAYVPTDWPTFCSTMVHEYGHLAGFRDPRNTEDPAHSINPYSVMYATEPPVTADLPGEWYRHKKVHVVVGYEPRCAYHGRAFLGLPTTGMTRELWAWKPTRVIARIARAEGEGWMLRLPR